MKRILLILACLPVFAMAQKSTSDSISMLPKYAVDVYYNIQTGHVDTVRNNNWHLAFAVRKALPPYQTIQATTIRINEANNVQLFASNTSLSGWSKFDTTGWMGWPEAFNGDSSWDIGAMSMNRNLADPFDYGWGAYDQNSRDVVGKKIWLVAIATSPNPADPKTLKKLFVNRVAYDTAWYFTISNLDGSDSTSVKIRKSDFNNKLFAYYNIFTHQVIDREPALNTWDLLFTRYKSLVTLYGQTLMYPLTGVLHHPRLLSAKLFSPIAKKDTVTPVFQAYKPHYTTIGWDWKVITVTPGAWPIKDSTAYFIQDASGPVPHYYKMVFTGFYSDASLQYITFNKINFAVTGFDELQKSLQAITVYPNPASNNLTVRFNNPVLANGMYIVLSDLSGRSLIQAPVDASFGGAEKVLNLEGLQSGMYTLTVYGNGASTTRKIMIQ